MTRAEVIEKVKALRSWYQPEWSLDGSTLYVDTSIGWSFSDMAEVAETLGTKQIDVVGEGCETCGYGARIAVGGINVSD